MADKIYIGTGKSRFFQDGGEIIGFRLFREDIEKINSHIDAQGGVNIDICKRKKPSDKGQTHYGTINQWQPDGKQAETPATMPTAARPDGGTVDDKGKEGLPF
jgi:hypothetical protein